MNKRKTERYLRNNCLEVTWKSHGMDESGVAVNLSQRGVDICCETPPQIGSDISITFQFEDERRGRILESVSGKVKWTRKLGVFHTGIEFLSEINKENHSFIVSQIERSKKED